MYTTGGLYINDDLKEVTVDGKPVKLTPLEYNYSPAAGEKTRAKCSPSARSMRASGMRTPSARIILWRFISAHIREKIEINPKEPRY